MTQELISLTQLETEAPSIDESQLVVESADFGRYPTQPVGEYTSRSRAIKARVNKEKGQVSFEVTCEGGVLDGDGKAWATKYPLKKWISTTPFKTKDRESGEEQPGTTSQVAQYLRACGISPKIDTFDDLIQAMVGSQETPVGVFVGWTDKRKQVDGEWVGLDLKTRDFYAGYEDEEGNKVYNDLIEVEDPETGELVPVEARPVIASFFKLKD